MRKLAAAAKFQRDEEAEAEALEEQRLEEERREAKAYAEAAYRGEIGGLAEHDIPCPNDGDTARAWMRPPADETPSESDSDTSSSIPSSSPSLASRSLASLCSVASLSALSPRSASYPSLSPSATVRTPPLSLSPTPRRHRPSRRPPRERIRIGFDSLLPPASFTPAPVIPGRVIRAGLDVLFSAPPALTCSLLGQVSFAITLNGSHVATGSVNGLGVVSSRRTASIGIDVVPVVMSRPIRGLATLARGVIKGALSGAVNGFVSGDWGGGAVVVGLRDVAVFDLTGRRVEWIEELVSGLSLERDMEAVKRLRRRAGRVVGSVADGLFDVVIQVMDAAGGPRGCSIL
ncbi:hypothetical protein BDK51DRAFT_38362 [Blyttiomyces helicus]|uniref:Uncharacterized protein n=1 Tax=Blyttiomyces helicus TaxID=388810 RepID=A0A4P9WNW3_9FUNG|nr:hypothetical protein BDK51DRAFT_38362 [Blyttiomyces helicus]|eukprot:RKO92890.1 hypothetical protein BDK51DRAFT_38362 [Blyttiomyces helicus]